MNFLSNPDPRYHKTQKGIPMFYSKFRKLMTPKRKERKTLNPNHRNQNWKKKKKKK